MSDEDFKLEGEVVGGTLSFSKITKFLRCGFQYYLAYVKRVRWAPTAPMLIGRGFHSGQEYGIKEMIGRATPSAKNVTDFAVASYEQEVKGEESIEYSEDDPNAETGKDDIAKMAGPVFEKVVSKLLPVSAEESFEVDAAGVVVRGRLDLKDTNGDGVNITELKTGSRLPEILTAFDWQQSIYQYSQKAVRGLRKIFSKRHLDKPRNFSVTVFEKKPDPDSLIADIVTGIGRVSEAIKSASVHGFVKTSDLRACAWCGYRRQCRPEIFGHEGQPQDYVSKVEIFTTKEKKEKTNGERAAKTSNTINA